MQRFRDAYQIIDPGACNPSGVARTLVKAIDECRADGEDPHLDPACRLICYQLAHLLGMEPLGSSYEGNGSDRIDSYRTDASFCQKINALSEAQLRSLRERWDRLTESKPTWTDFLREVQPMIGGDGAVSAPWAGMWLCVETDGHCHT